MMEHSEDDVMAVNSDMVLSALPAEKQNGVEGDLKLRAGPHECAPHGFDVSIPLKLDGDQVTVCPFFRLQKEMASVY